MPLSHGKSDASRSKNIATEIRAGKPPAQAAAIAYSEQRKARESHAKGGVIACEHCGEEHHCKGAMPSKKSPSLGEHLAERY